MPEEAKIRKGEEIDEGALRAFLEQGFEEEFSEFEVTQLLKKIPTQD